LNAKPPASCGGFLKPLGSRLFLLVGLQEAGEFLLEAGHAATTVDELLLAASPSWMRLRVNVEMQDITLFAPGGAGGELAAIGHYHLDGVVARMDILFHRRFPGRAAAPIGGEFGGSYTAAHCRRQAAQLTTVRSTRH
jgi:hypothetical protein